MTIVTLLFYIFEVYFIAVFHDAIVGAVPRIVELFEDKDYNIRATGEKAMEKLFEYGKWSY